jgi:rhamnosyltransferase
MNFMSGCASVIVTYFPDRSSLDNIELVADFCTKVVVIDNTPGNISVHFPTHNNVILHRFGENRGLATALNKGIQIAAAEGVESIFLFDQDSRPPYGFFHKMLTFKERIESENDYCILYVPNFFDVNSKTYAKFPVLNGIFFKHLTCKNFTSGICHHPTVAITSGSLLNYSSFNKIGPFRDDYFIDFIDNEYCLRVYKRGFRIAINCGLVMDHAIGKRFRNRFLGIPINSNNHPALRRYYMARNGLRTALDYLSFCPSFLPLILARLGSEMLSVLFYETDKYRKVRAIFYGVCHGLTGRLGKCMVTALCAPPGFH